MFLKAPQVICGVFLCLCLCYNNIMKKIILFSVIILTACTDTTEIQRDYVDFRDKCREISELKLEFYIKSQKGLSTKDKNAQLTTIFSDCMFSQGWIVATPPRERQKDEGSIITERKKEDKVSKE